MKRHFYLSSDLDELQRVEHDLEMSGVDKPQIHVLSNSDQAVENHHLHEVDSILKQDLIHSGSLGLLLGLGGGGAVLTIAALLELPSTYTWVPFGFLAAIVFGFCTWEGAFIGIQRPHRDFQRFADTLKAGGHVFFVDVDEAQEGVLASVLGQHPQLRPAGTGPATPVWVINAQRRWDKFSHWAP